MLLISQPEFDGLRRHGEQAYPYECCGVLLGHFDGERNVVKAAIRCTNTRTDSPHNRYSIDARELVKIQKEARERGYDLVGFYHSHPDHPAQWSPTDLAEAHWIGCSYVITSIENGTATVTSSFRLAGTLEEDKRFEDELIQLVNK